MYQTIIDYINSLNQKELKTYMKNIVIWHSLFSLMTIK